MFYGSDTHAEGAAAIFSIVASCRLHGIDPHQCLEEIFRVLSDWPGERYLELAPSPGSPRVPSSSRRARRSALHLHRPSCVIRSG